MEVIFQALKVNSTLTQLDIFGKENGEWNDSEVINKIDDLGAKEIGAALIANAGLTELDLNSEDETNRMVFKKNSRIKCFNRFG